MSYYIHNVPGRLRVKSPAVRRNSDAEYDLRKILGTINGIATVDINRTTGSILINYNPRVLNHKDILVTLQNKGYFDSSRAETNDEYLKRVASKAGNVIGRALFGTFLDIALEESALSFLSLLI